MLYVRMDPIPGLDMKPSNPAIVVLQTFDVILAEVISTLDFNHNDIVITDVHDPVPCALGNIHRLASFQMDLIFVYGHNGASLDNIPVFPSAKVSLEAQTLLGENNNALHFMFRLIGKDTEITPWPVLDRYWRLHPRLTILPKRFLKI